MNFEIQKKTFMNFHMNFQVNIYLLKYKLMITPLHLQVVIILNLGKDVYLDDDPEEGEEDGHASNYLSIELQTPVAGGEGRKLHL